MAAFTIHPSAQPEPPDRHVGQMPPGWTPTPPTPQERAAYLRSRAGRLEVEIELARKVGNTAREFALTDDLAKVRHKANQYEKLALWQAQQPKTEDRPPPRRTTFVIGG